MRKFFLFAAALLISLPSALAADGPKDLPYASLNRGLTERVVLPAYAKLTPAMERLAQASETFCVDPPTGGYAGLISTFHAAMDAWQHAQPIAFGPVAVEGRAARIEFWPDSGGSTDRQIRRVLSEQTPALIAPGGLDGKSVALQNLTTFERLLAEHASRLVASSGGTDEDRYACRWMIEIARFQARLAATIEHEWTSGYAATVLGAELGNATYANARAATTDYLKSLVGSLDVVIRQKLERPMDASVAKARAARAESWRTKRSLANIVANLETARDLFSVPDGFGDLLTAAGSGPLAAGMRDGFDAAVAAARGLGKPLEDSVGDTIARPRLDELVRQIRALRTLIAGPLSTETDLVVGFNSLDGD